MQKYLYMFLMLFVTARVFADVPEWVRNFDVTQKYPPKTYLAAISVASGNDSEASKLAQNSARSEVSKIIVVNIKSLISSVKEEKDNEYSQYLSSIVLSSTSIQLMGLQVELYPDNDKKDPKIYAVAYASKSDLSRIYTKKKNELTEQIHKILTDAKADEESSRFIDAVKKYLNTYPLYEELKEAETILLVVGHSSAIENAFKELESETGIRILSQSEVLNRIEQLLSQSLGSVSDIARAIVLRLSQQVGSLSKQVWVNPFTYQDTGMSGSFARYFQSELETSMVQMADWKLPSKSRALAGKSESLQSIRDIARNAGAQWYIYGNYWEQGDKVKLIVTMRDVETNKVIAGTDLVFDTTVLAQNMTLKPVNYESALITQQAFEEGQIVSGQLNLEVWSDRGNENLLYTEGEVMKVYIRVNRECYIRLLYILADGRWTLLYDNYFIDKSKVNQIVEIPTEFECAPPFGAEMLVVIARTDKFSKPNTIVEDGYEFLDIDPQLTPETSARSLAEEIRRGKGFKEKKGPAVSIKNQDFQNDLNNNKITDLIMQEFEKNNIPLSLNATVSTIIENNEWLITDLNSMQTYLLRMENDIISIFKVQQAESKLVITTMPK